MFIIELSYPDCVTVCRKNGSRIGSRSKLYADLKDCTKSGDAENACRFVLTQHKPEFRIVKQIDGKYENVIATHSDKIAICKAIYFESESDFGGDETLCEIYLVWQAASDFDS